MIGVAGRLSARVERRRGLENGDGLLQLGVLPLQLPDLPRRGGRRPVDLAGLDLGLTQPLQEHRDDFGSEYEAIKAIAGRAE
jgi:hypothetical protein